MNNKTFVSTFYIYFNGFVIGIFTHTKKTQLLLKLINTFTELLTNLFCKVYFPISS